MCKFWVIIGKDSMSTAVGNYYSKEEADNEVERLVKKEGKVFILLEAIEWCEPKEVPVLWHGMGGVMAKIR